MRRDLARADARRPAGDQRDPDTAFEQVHLFTDQRPGIGEAFAAVVAGEDNQGVVVHTSRAQGVEQQANTLVHLADHGLVGLDRTAVGVGNIGDASGQCLVRAGFPGPVRCGEVHARKERLTIGCTLPDEACCAVSDQVGKVTIHMDCSLVVVQVMLTTAITVREVVHAARQGAEERLVTTFAWPEMGWKSQMPLAEQCSAVTAVPQQGRQCRVVWR